MENLMKKVLISTQTGLGNSVLLSLLLFKIKKNNYKVEILDNNRFGSVDFLKTLNLIDRAINLDNWKSLLHHNYEKIIFPAMTEYNYIFPILYKIIHPYSKVIVQTNNKKISNLYRLFGIKIISFDLAIHESFNYLKLLNENINRKEILLIESEFLSYTSTLKWKFKNNKFGRYIVIQPITSNGRKSSKQWPLPKWEEFLSLYIREKIDYKIIIVGEDTERKIINNSLGKYYTCDKIINYCGKTSIQELIELVANSSLVIAPDSSVAHIAGAFNKKLILLWGSSIYSKSHPIGKNITLLMKPMICQPCMGPTLYSDEESFNKCKSIDCMNAISPKEVLETVKNLLRK